MRLGGENSEHRGPGEPCVEGWSWALGLCYLIWVPHPSGVTSCKVWHQHSTASWTFELIWFFGDHVEGMQRKSSNLTAEYFISLFFY